MERLQGPINPCVCWFQFRTLLPPNFFQSPSLDSTKWTAFTSLNACIQCFVCYFPGNTNLCSAPFFFVLNIPFLFHFIPFFLTTHDFDFLFLVSFICFKVIDPVANSDFIFPCFLFFVTFFLYGFLLNFVAVLWGAFGCGVFGTRKE